MVKAGALCAGLLIATHLAAGAASADQSEHPPAKPRNVFELAPFVELQQRLTIDVLQLFRQQRYGQAEVALGQLIAAYPGWPAHSITGRRPTVA